MLAPSLALVFTGAGLYSLDGLVNSLDKGEQRTAPATAGTGSTRRAA